jgi:hypothetical protein
MRLTAHNLVRAISLLPRDIEYQYVHKANKGRIVIHRVSEVEGRVEFKRYFPLEGQKLADAKVEAISNQMIWRLANSIIEGRPVNVDRALGASYNTRSVLEALLAHTPLFYSCMPGRIEAMNEYKEEKAGHKHLVYLPSEPHENAKIGFRQVNMIVSELATDEVVYDGIKLDPTVPITDMTIAQKRRHAQIQIALVLIGEHLGFRTWVAANDHSIEYAGKKIIMHNSVVSDLSSEQVLSAYPDAAKSARLIDCIWFRNGRLMPAVMEVEHSTGVTSGLVRMKGFFDSGPALRDIRWTIVAPDEDRQKVLQEANREQFKPLNTKFFPYSAVEELYSLCERRKPKGVTDAFLDCFMEDCVVQ